MEELLTVKGKLLGVDFGDVRTGLALSDPSQILASGIGKISPGGIVRVADAIAEFAKEENVAGIVVGLPVNMDGSRGKRAERCAELAALLRERLDLPVVLSDERMTTMVAARYLNETDTRGKKRKNVVDTLSAQIILQDALDRLAHLRGTR